MIVNQLGMSNVSSKWAGVLGNANEASAPNKRKVVQSDDASLEDDDDGTRITGFLCLLLGNSCLLQQLSCLLQQLSCLLHTLSCLLYSY